MTTISAAWGVCTRNVRTPQSRSSTVATTVGWVSADST